MTRQNDLPGVSVTTDLLRCWEQLNNGDANTPNGEFGLFARTGASNTTPPADRRLNGTRVFGP